MDSEKTANSSLYREYRDAIESDRLVRSLRVGCFIVAVLSTAFIPLDFAAFRERFVPMLTFRLFCNATMGVIILWGARSYPLGSAIVGSLTTGAMLLMVIFAAGGVTSDYTPGLMLLFLGMPVLLPFTAVQAGFIVSILTLGLAALPMFGGNRLGMEAYSLHIVFPIAAGVESVAASAMLDKLRFADFLRTKEIERARDDLKELDREKSRFTSNVHHELRTPLTLMLAPVDALLDGTFGEIADLPKSYLRSVRANGQRLLKLINNLLDLAKIEDRKYSLRKSPISMKKLIDDYVASAMPLAEQKGVSLQTRWNGKRREIFADPDAIEKVVANLLGNALKFTPEGGEIEILGEHGIDGGVHLIVRDTGVGIPAEKIESIFDRFAQVDTSITRKFEGTGIGLSLVKELVELHEGSAWAESQGMGMGTAMHVILPLGEACADTGKSVAGDDGISEVVGSPSGIDMVVTSKGESAERELSLSEIRRNLARANEDDPGEERVIQVCRTGAPRVLIVEDNRDMRRFLAHLLADEYQIEVAANGRTGLEAARRTRPDLVLTDVMMPEMSGTDLCASIKSDPEMKAIPVVLVTSKADSEMKIRGLELGADDYVTKPFHPKELIARVRSLVRVSTLQREVISKNARLEMVNRELTKTLADLKEAESALVQAERLAAVGELAAGLAHEVNNPVNFATNALRTLRMYVSDVSSIALRINALEVDDDSQLRSQAAELARCLKSENFEEVAASLDELVGIVVEGLSRTERLVGDLQKFASPSIESVGPVDVGDCIRSTLQLVRFVASERGVSLHSEFSNETPRVFGSEQALSQVFLNLVKNAIDAVSPRKGNVWVRAFRESGSVVVVVADDGPGISPDVADQLFNPFVTTKPAGKGTGLGLAISKRVVIEHNGEIRVGRSAAGGAEFWISLPAVVEDLRDEYATET